MRHILVLSLLGASAYGAAVTPACPSFGTAGVTFQGSGIDGTACFTTITAPNGDLIKIALSATPRVVGMFTGDPVSTDGAGTYNAVVGPSTPGHAQWNFNFHTSVVGTDNYIVQLLYDLDPGLATNDLPEHGSITAFNVNSATPLNGPTGTQNSWNIGFGFLSTGGGGIAAPSPLFAVDPNAVGEYTFRLSVASTSGVPLGSVAILVNTNVPEPGTYAMLGGGLALMCLLRRKRKA